MHKCGWKHQVEFDLASIKVRLVEIQESLLLLAADVKTLLAAVSRPPVTGIVAVPGVPSARPPVMPMAE